MTLTFPFEIGQAIWSHTRIDDEWVTVLCEVEGYAIDEYGIEVTVRYAGGKKESLCLSTDGKVNIDEDQVKANFLFERRDDLLSYLKEENLL